MEIDQLAKEHHIKFSMFVDDITLSSKVDFKNLVPQFLAIIKVWIQNQSQKDTLSN